jgi:cytochrome c oxidase subunit IV
MTDDTDDRERASYLWKGPAVTWLVLLGLFAVNAGSAYLPLGTANITINLLVAGAMIVVLAIFLMDLRHSTTLLRIIALSGLFWTTVMFALTFNDYLSRYY